MGLVFEWDPRKAARNLRKHGVSFDEGCSAFGDPLSVTIPDPDHSDDEARFVLLGMTQAQHLVVVAYTERDDTIRLITVRRATPTERRQYEES